MVVALWALFKTILTTLLGYVLQGLGNACIMMAAALFISGALRWSRLDRVYLQILSFIFKQNDYVMLKRHREHIYTPFERSHGAQVGKPQCSTLDTIYDKFKPPDTEKASSETKNHKMNVFDDTLELVGFGLAAMVDDDFTPRFRRQRLMTWNMLGRTWWKYPVPWWNQAAWALGVIVRYAILLPLRLLCLAGFYTSWCALVLAVAAMPARYANFRRPIYRKVVTNRPTRGLTVANHTSPLDVVVLLNDVAYSLVGQRQNGYLGVFQDMLNQLAPQIWFERTSATERNATRQKLTEHTRNPDNPPIVLFPEGTCTNNTAVTMFKNGSFDCQKIVHPVAIKYDPMFCDFYWNSARESSFRYLVHVFTSWHVVCDVWYLEPMTQHADESTAEFTQRVKRAIAMAARLDETPWDGNLKRCAVKEELKARARLLFSRRF